MDKISKLIIDFVEKSIKLGDIDHLDKYYTQNRLLALFNLKEIDRVSPSNPLNESRLDILDGLLNEGIKLGIIEDNASEKDVLGAQIMDLITPSPYQVNKQFREDFEKGPQLATDNFFDLSKKTNYIKTREIAQNQNFTHKTEYGELELTINLSKPEKTSKEIAEAKENTSNYPFNALSIENEGYKGHIAHAGRTSHRVIRFNVNGEVWGFQYSPYAYYNEHSIFISMEHRPMKVDINTVSNLLKIVELIPHYFVGSNAGLPIVGGSILAQDHYQGGRHTFTLDRAEIEAPITIDGVSGVDVGIVKWPMSTIRIQGKQIPEVLKAAERIIEVWSTYSDESVDIQAFSDGEPHNAFTPLVRRQGEDFVVDIVLRNNRTNDQYPDGIFHPHPENHHIKKENIGLIEVLGLAVLPPRLKDEFATIKRYLLGGIVEVPEVHKNWVKDIEEKHTDITEENVDEIIQSEAGEIFLDVLKNAGVFKTTSEGREAFKRFIAKL